MIEFLTQFQQKVLKELQRAAESGEPCPTNPGLATRFGAQSTSTPAHAVKRIEQLGLIRVWRFGESRVVEIVATGQRTAGDITKPQRRYGPGSRPPKGQVGAKPETVPRSDGVRAGLWAAMPHEGTAVPAPLPTGSSGSPSCGPRDVVRRVPVVAPQREEFHRRAVTGGSSGSLREGEVHATPLAREGLRAAEPAGAQQGMAPPAPSAAPSPRRGGGCCWPMWPDDAGRDHPKYLTFCRRPVMKRDYCAEHYAVAYGHLSSIAAE